MQASARHALATDIIFLAVSFALPKEWKVVFRS
jgi:hypothetical protein